jgi:prepilin-type N-terminal cleavage/methylation domain-containing protein
MKSAIKQSGFSLTEVLMAVGILSIAMMMIAAMFPVAIYLTSVAAERTMAAIVADEAFAKIQLYGFENPVPQPDDSTNRAIFYDKTYDYEQAHNDPCLGGTYDLFPDINEINPIEFSYPPVDPCTNSRQYYWSALCRKLDANATSTDTQYLVTVFVARKTNPALTYYWYDPCHYCDPNRPRVIDIDVNDSPSGPDRLKIVESDKAKYVNPPTTIFDANTGQFYRVTDKIGIGNIDANIVTLDRNWDANGQQRPVWLIPPPETGGRNAGIEVYGPRIIKF